MKLLKAQLQKINAPQIPKNKKNQCVGTFTHGGIYAGNGQFVHATRRGLPVMVTPMDGDYFGERYMTALRLSPR